MEGRHSNHRMPPFVHQCRGDGRLSAAFRVIVSEVSGSAWELASRAAYREGVRARDYRQVSDSVLLSESETASELHPVSALESRQVSASVSGSRPASVSVLQSVWALESHPVSATGSYQVSATESHPVLA